MRFVHNALLGRDLSVLGFGAAAVMGRVGRRASLAALGQALDAGINVFDTARSYGYGESEALLGEFFAGRRHEVVLSTKFGILPARQSKWKNVAKPIARLAVHAVPALRKSMRGQVAAQFQPGQFSVQALQSSVETSLKKLRTDYLDILFMHEATEGAAQDDELIAAMDALMKQGKIRVAGISAEPEIAVAAAGNPAIRALQFPCNLENDFAEVINTSGRTDQPLRFANHSFGGASGVEQLRSKLGNLTAGTELSVPLAAKLEEVPASMAELVLNLALAAGNDVVLATMMKPEHLRANTRAVSECRFTSEELVLLRRKLTTRQASPQSNTEQPFAG